MLAEKGKIRWSGPIDSPRIAIVGDMPDHEEERLGRAFAGEGHDHNFSLLCRSSGIDRDHCYITKVFLDVPPYDWEADWLVTKTEYKKLTGRTCQLPPMVKAKHLHPDKEGVLQRLKLELERVRPNLVLALGPVALWALTGITTITKARGSIVMSTLVKGLKVMPSFSPNALKGQYDLMPIMAADWMKANKLSETRENIIPKRLIWINPTLMDISDYFYEHIEQDDGAIAIDVETQQKQITHIGFGSSKSSAIVIPFWSTKRAPSPDPNVYNYWQTVAAEVEALNWVAKYLEHPRAKVFQNGMYDMAYIWKTFGMRIRNVAHDTMLLHHSLQPELLKGLGFLGSVYTDEPSWKGMRKSAMDTEKRDE